MGLSPSPLRECREDLETQKNVKYSYWMSRAVAAMVDMACRGRRADGKLPSCLCRSNARHPHPSTPTLRSRSLPGQALNQAPRHHPLSSRPGTTRANLREATFLGPCPERDKVSRRISRRNYETVKFSDEEILAGKAAKNYI